MRCSRSRWQRAEADAPAAPMEALGRYKCLLIMLLRQHCWGSRQAATAAGGEGRNERLTCVMLQKRVHCIWNGCHDGLLYGTM
jgi:hypothetical protein